MNKTVFIYALKEPDTGEIRYVGKSYNVQMRFRKHLSSAFVRINRKTSWIRSLLNRGTKPELEILDEVPIEHWQQWEVAWIEYFKESGAKLVNGTPGGESAIPMFGKDNPMFGKPRPEEVRKKISKGHIGKSIGPEVRQKISVALKGRKLTPEICANRTIVQTGLKRRENTSSKFVGVYWHKRDKIWTSRITVQGKKLDLGRHDSEEDAAIVYDWVSRLYFGESARTNFQC